MWQLLNFSIFNIDSPGISKNFMTIVQTLIRSNSKQIQYNGHIESFSHNPSAKVMRI